MSDPAIDAAKRAMQNQFGHSWSDPSYTLKVRADAAREALAPARDWFERENARLAVDAAHFRRWDLGAELAVIRSEQAALRALAPLLYSSDELGDNP
ncbi:hypothetical protein PP512_gp57 [Gordonia phage Denise]|uniref:Uncharacterized protein n=1 Tax=Gordonia phage Denise TaxID=2652879 RepID=A0A5P8DE28_9CAUD|nr:hypothetical protein PP512_gp57 [Gordonia phage Denise]QFP96672.1 hypothetical protein SEA_DENISE_57 [Gordonia phage Denise]